jgi:hypothetical protein
MLIEYNYNLKGMIGMYKLTEKQELKMDKEMIASASSYAHCLMDAVKDALANDNKNLLLVTPNEEEGTISTTFFYEKCSYIRAGILELAQEVTGKQRLTTYESFSEHLLIFEKLVNDNMQDGWIFSYGENDDAIAIKTEEVAA